MFSEVTCEIDYLNKDLLPFLKEAFGAGCLNTGLILRCAENPSLVNVPELQYMAVELRYQDCMKYSGKAMTIDKARFTARYYATEEGKAYKQFLDELPPDLKERYSIF